MKPIKFKESNSIVTGGEFEPLPGYKTKEGIFITGWKLSFWDKIRIIFTGTVWISIMTYNKPINPMYVTTIKKELI